MATILLSYRGNITGIPDQFVHTLTCQAPSVDLPAQAANAVAAHEAAVLAHSSVYSEVSSTVDYVDATAAEVLDLSTGALSAAATAQYVTPPAGTGPALPAQIALAVSLVGGTRPNGVPLRGRFYLPPISAGALANDGKVSSSDRSAFAAFLGTWFSELAERDLQPGVWSRTLGTWQALTSARLGDVPDTIRTRRNGAAETYSTITVP